MPITRLLRNCVLAFLVALAAPAFSQDIAREFFPPTSGKGAPVVVVSGLSGTSRYREHAAKLASLGYFAVLIDGKDVLFRTGDAMDPAGQGNLRKVLTQTLADPRSSLSKVALVGFSLGGGGVLQWGTALSDQVSAAVVFYPSVSLRGQDMKQFARRMKVPVLVFAGARDKYDNCCLLETMRALEARAREVSAPLELVVYENANHGFNLRGRGFREADATDSWAKLVAFLARHQAK